MHPSRSRALVVATGAVAALALSGCSLMPGASEQSQQEEDKGTPGLPEGVKVDTKVPTEVPNTPEARRNVQITECGKTDDGWRAAGNVRNPGDEPAKYKITIFFTTETATVIGTGETEVTVDPKQEAEWEVADAFRAAEKTLCVLRGVG